MGKLLSSLLFRMMPKVEGMTCYSDLLVMYDNLDRPMTEVYTPEIEQFIESHLPQKISFTVAMLCMQGEVSIKCSSDDLVITKGGLIVLPFGVIVEKLSFGKDSKVVVIVVPDTTLVPDSSFQDSIYKSSNFTSPVAIQLEEGELESGVNAYKLLKHGLTHSKFLSRDLVKAYMTLLAGIASVGFQRWLIKKNSEKVSNKEQVVKDFLDNLAEDYKEYRDVSHYAEKAGLSPKYFAKLVFNESGRHPLDWIKEKVVEDAKQMLRAGVSIAEICQELNFPDRSQFNRYFKAAVGLAPGEYLKQSSK